MRRMWIGGAFALVIAVGFGLSAGSTRGQPGGAGNDAQHKKVTVSGTATVAVKPDTARVSFAVKAGGQDFKTASAECDKKAASVEKALKDLKIGGLEIKKGPLNFTQHAGGFGPGFPGGGPVPGGPPPGNVPGAAPPPAPPAMGVDVLAAQPLPGGGPPPLAPGWGGSFEVSRTFTVIATFGKQDGAGNLDEIVAVADKLLSAAVTAGATEAPAFTTPAQNPFGGFGGGGMGGRYAVNRIEFYRANLAPLRQEAIKLAVADALANAKVAAGAANLTTKDIVSITDQSQFGGPFGLGGGAVNTGRGEVLGEQELTMTLSVTFSY